MSTTQTVVGALIGVGFASGAPIKWAWDKGSVSQVAASWAIAPLLAAAFSAVLFGTLKYGVLERKDSFKMAMRVIPFYFAFTASILALFIVVEAPTAPSLEEFGAGKAAGIILGVFFGVLAIVYVFFMPFFERKLIRKDPRLRIWHVPLGPLLRKENVSLYFPGKGEEYVVNYYEDAYGEVRAGRHDEEKVRRRSAEGAHAASEDGIQKPDNNNGHAPAKLPEDHEKALSLEERSKEDAAAAAPLTRRRRNEPYERWITPVKGLSWANPQRWWGYFKFGLLHGE